MTILILTDQALSAWKAWYSIFCAQGAI